MCGTMLAGGETTSEDVMVGKVVVTVLSIALLGLVGNTPASAHGMHGGGHFGGGHFMMHRGGGHFGMRHFGGGAFGGHHAFRGGTFAGNRIGRVFHGGGLVRPELRGGFVYRGFRGRDLYYGYRRCGYVWNGWARYRSCYPNYPY